MSLLTSPVVVWTVLTATGCVIAYVSARALAQRVGDPTRRYWGEALLVAILFSGIVVGYLFVDVPGAVRAGVVVSSVPSSLSNLLAWLPLGLGLVALQSASAVGTNATRTHDDSSRFRAAALAGAVISALLAVPLVVGYVSALRFGVLGGSLVAVVAYYTFGAWLSVRTLEVRGTLREPTEDERRQVRAMMDEPTRLERYPLLLFDPDNPSAEPLIAVLGVPTRRVLVVGADVSTADQEVVRAMLALQLAQAETGLLDRWFLARISRTAAAGVILVSFFSMVPPTPGLGSLFAMAAGAVVVVAALESWCRRGVFAADRRAVREVGAESLEAVLRMATEGADTSSGSRLAEHVELTPSVERRVDAFTGTDRSGDALAFC